MQESRGGGDKKFPSLERKPNPHNRKLPLRPCSQQITTWLLKAGILSPTNVAHKALKAGDSLSIPLPLPWHSCGFFTHSRHPRNICAPTPNLLVHGNTSYSCRLVSGRDPRGSMLFFLVAMLVGTVVAGPHLQTPLQGLLQGLSGTTAKGQYRGVLSETHACTGR